MKEELGLGGGQAASLELSRVSAPEIETHQNPDISLRAKVVSHAVCAIDEFAAQVRADISDRLIPELEIAIAIEDGVAPIALTLLSAIAGRNDSAAQLQLARSVRRCARRGVALHVLLRLCDVTASVVWRGVLSELGNAACSAADAGDASVAMSGALLEATSRVSEIVLAAFAEAERELHASADHTRTDIFDELLSGSTLGLRAVRERAERAGLVLGDVHVAVVIAIESGRETALLQTAIKRVRGVLSALGDTGREVLTQVRAAGIRVLVPVRAGAHERELQLQLAAALEDLELPDGVSVLAATGRCEQGIAGIPVTYRQALRALEGAQATGVHHGVVTYSGMLPTLMLLAEPRLALDLWRATIEPLEAHDEEFATLLVPTLVAYLDERGVLAATAKRLFVHRHTLAPRLERIEALTGRSLRDRSDLLMLEIGLRAQTLVDDGYNTLGVVRRRRMHRTVVSETFVDRRRGARA